MRSESAPESVVPIGKLAAGDAESWNRAYAPLFREIMIVLKARLRGGFGVDAEDIAVGIITEDLMKGLRSGSSESFARLREWEDLLRLARTIAARRAIDTIRKIARRKEEAMPEGWEIAIAEESAPGTSDHEDFMKLIGQLKPPKPSLFADHFIGGMSYQEIATAREMALGTVCCHFKRGFDELRAKLANRRPAERSGR